MAPRRKQKLLDRFLTVFGDLKVFRWPMFIVYDPGSYRLRGEHMREVMNLVQPGDILLRRYDHYLDGFFIPGYFSHVGLYLGRVGEAETALAPASVRGQVVQGEQVVIHALAEGVLMEDLLNFCRCDGLVVMRPPRVLTRRWSGPPPAFASAHAALSPEERELFDRLESGAQIDFEQEALPIVLRTALAQLGRGYDFDFDFTDFRALSCSEFVFHATKALAPAMDILPRLQRIAFLQRLLIPPDAFVDGNLERAYQSPSVDPQRLASLLRRRPMDAAGDAAESRRAA